MKREDGYSLVEVSLALLVLGVGLLAVFALFPDALGSARKSVDASEVSEFAEYVFASIEGAIAEPNFNWDSLSSTYKLPKSDVLVFSQPQVEGTAAKKNYEWLPNFYESDGVAKHVLAKFTYTLKIDPVPGTSLKSVKLVVWPGDMVAANPPVSAGKTFYREYAPFK